MRQLLARIPADHAHSEPMRKAASQMIEVAERFTEAKATMTRSGRYTQAGLNGALREVLPGYAAQMEAAKAPLTKLKREAAQRRLAIRVKTPDPSNLAAALERAEIRTFFRGMEPGARNALLAGTRDLRILEALLTAPPELSGLDDPRMKQLAERIEAAYLEIVHGPEAKALDVMEEVVAPTDAIAKVARNKVRDEMGMDERTFSGIVGPAEKAAGLPWIVGPENDPMVCEVDEELKQASYRRATEWEREVGVRYKNADEWRAAQGEATAA